MRGRELLDLQRLDLTNDELRRKSDAATRHWHFDSIGHEADAYSEAIGPPIFEEEIDSSDVSEDFKGSLMRRYRLCLWPQVLFCVCRHPWGFAWGLSFIEDSMSVSSQVQLPVPEPWKTTLLAIENNAILMKLIESWNYETDLLVTWGQIGAEAEYMAQFDYGLLQKWEQITG